MKKVVLLLYELCVNKNIEDNNVRECSQPTDIRRQTVMLSQGSLDNVAWWCVIWRVRCRVGEVDGWRWAVSAGDTLTFCPMAHCLELCRSTRITFHFPPFSRHSFYSCACITQQTAESLNYTLVPIIIEKCCYVSLEVRSVGQD